MIRSQKFVTSKHNELSFNQCNSIVIGLIRIIERGKNGFISLVKRSFFQAFVYFHLLYNVCQSMAKTEENKESCNPDLLQKTLLVNENSEDVDDATYISEDNSLVVKPVCIHSNKAVNLNQVRKRLISPTVSTKCILCETNNSLVDENESSTLVCLQCGVINCPKHAQQHFETPRSDLHCLVLKINDWIVRCLLCESDVPLENSKLKESVTILKKLFNTSDIKLKKTLNVTSTVTAMESSAHSSKNNEATLLSVVPKPRTVLQARGLINLGNTCFFNSVLQCLAQTPFLLELLIEISEPGEKAVLAIDNETPLTVELDKWGSVTEALAITLTQLTQGSGGAYSPAHLLEALRKKYRQFMGYNQHDAHELLRQLLDSVKNEDIRRYQIHIIQYFGFSKKTNPEDIDEKKKALAKELNKRLTEIVNIRPDPVFRGALVSTHQCMKCHQKSEVIESFLDLSLPVSFLKSQPPPIIRKKNEFGEKPKSKHQKKKEKKAARKANKLAKIKKRLKDEENRSVTNPVIEMKDVNESGYSSGKAASPEQCNNGNQLCNDVNSNEILAEALNEINYGDEITKLQNSQTNSNSSTVIDKDYSYTSEVFEKVEEIDSPSEVGNTSPTLFPVTNSVNGEGMSQSEISSPLVPDMRFCLLGPSTTVSKMSSNSSSSCSDDEKDEEDNHDDNLDDDIAEDEDEVSREGSISTDSEMRDYGFCATLQPPAAEYEENSIQACLSEFTACEVLTGNNKLKCESCTERLSKSTGEKRAIYQPITKQLLIKSPPPVLILHLKRFEMRSAFSFSSVSLRKAEKLITYPLILDIGSFCSVNCEKLLVPSQKKILYSLYGIVEHSGSLNSGHYVAYIKARKPVDKNSYRRLFLPTSKLNQFESIDINDLEQKVNEHKTCEKQWYYISDSCVRSIPEEDVLHRQAYLLFYERIL